MITKDEILNVYRHAKGLFTSAEKLARAEGVIRCPQCEQIHDVGTPHGIGPGGVIVEHKKTGVTVAKH